jgi:isocitrate/isopropylmalate dehydrogenase
MSYQVVVLPGDGVGVEVMEQGLKILDTLTRELGIAFQVEKIPCGGQYYLAHREKGLDWPKGSEEKCASADLILLGAVGWPREDGKGPVCLADGRMAGYSPVLGNRMKLNLFANVRPVKLYEGVKQRIHGDLKAVWEPGKVDMVFVRENTECLYADTHGTLSPGGIDQVALDGRLITRKGSEQVIRFAFELCKKRNRGAPKDGKLRVTCVDKDNVLAGCKLFTKVFYEIGEAYPEIEKEHNIVDAFTQWLLNKPEHYNVIVTPNMFGDILTDLASVLQGGMGLAASGNIGENHGMFEPIHGSSPKYTNKNKVNPLATLLAVREGLMWLADKKADPLLFQAAQLLESAVEEVLREGKILTYDMLGEEKASTCSAVTDHLMERFSEKLRPLKPSANEISS